MTDNRRRSLRRTPLGASLGLAFGIRMFGPPMKRAQGGAVWRRPDPRREVGLGGRTSIGNWVQIVRGRHEPQRHRVCLGDVPGKGCLVAVRIPVPPGPQVDVIPLVELVQGWADTTALVSHYMSDQERSQFDHVLNMHGPTKSRFDVMSREVCPCLQNQRDLVGPW